MDLGTRESLHFNRDARNYAQLLARLKDETNPNTNVPFAGHELWPVQEDGNFCEKRSSSLNLHHRNHT